MWYNKSMWFCFIAIFLFNQGSFSWTTPAQFPTEQACVRYMETTINAYRLYRYENKIPPHHMSFMGSCNLNKDEAVH